MHAHIQRGDRAAALHGLLKGAAHRHQGGRRDDPRLVGQDDPFIDAAGYPEIVGVDDQPDGWTLPGWIAGGGGRANVSHGATGGGRRNPWSR
jgi:hypothetical protein